jgi:hypothetical protein
VPLADIQRQIRDAVVSGQTAPIEPLLVGGQNPLKRLATHRHHYEASLTAAVVGCFPATGWLVGPRRLEDAARQFVHQHPPTAPCVAEYGAEFPAFLATWPDTAPLIYVPEFADLDWHLGRVSVSVDMAAVEREHLATMDPTDVADARATLQPGTHYLRANRAIDELITMYLADSSPESWELVEMDVYIEVHGARGSLHFSHLTAGEYAFRSSVAEGHTLGDAAGRALEIDPAFDPGGALLTLLDARLVTSIERSPAGGQS